MSIKTNFGNITELIGFETAPTIKADKNIVISLDGKIDNTIHGISAEIRLPRISPATVIVAARLLFVGSKFENVEELILPNSHELPASLSSSAIYIHRYLSTEKPYIEINFENGFPISKGTSASIILTYAETDNEVYPNAHLTIGSLSVWGVSGKSNSPFKNLR